MKHKHERVVRSGWRIFKPRLDHGRWAWRLRHEEGDEKTYFKATSHRKLDAAAEFEEWFERLLRREAEAQEKKPTERTLAEAFEEWLGVVRDIYEVRAVTLEGYRSQLIHLFLPEFERIGRLHVHEVEYGDVESIFRRHAKRWRGRTNMKHLSLLKRVFAWAKKKRYTLMNPAEEYGRDENGRLPAKWRRELRESRNSGLALTEAQCRELLRACREPVTAMVTAREGNRRTGQEWTQTTYPPEDLYTTIMLALRAGLRPQTIPRVRWQHLKNDMTELHLTDKETKTHGPLVVPIHSELRTYLKGLLQKRREERGRAPRPTERLVQADSTKKAFKSVRKRAGLSELVDGTGKVRAITLRDMRHTFSSMLSTLVPEAVKNVLMGHVATSIADRYTHLSIDDLREPLERLPWLFPQSQEAQAENL